MTHESAPQVSPVAETIPVEEWEVRELLAVAGLAAPHDLDLEKVDADLAQYLSTCPNPGTVVLRAMGFGEDLTFLKSERSSPPRKYPSDRMDPDEAFYMAAQPPQPRIRPYN